MHTGTHTENLVTTQQLLDVEGIGEGLLEKLRPYVYVEEIE